MFKVLDLKEHASVSKMVSFANDSLHHLIEIEETPIDIKDELLDEDYKPSPVNYQIIKIEEPLIEVNEEPGGPDPLLINESFEPVNNRLLKNGLKSRRTYRKQAPKCKNVVKMIPKIPLEGLVIEAIETDGSPQGRTTTAIKGFLFARYGMDVGIPEITKALQVGIESGVISQIRRTKRRKLKGRYVLSKFHPSETDSRVKRVKGWKKSLLKRGRPQSREGNIETDVKNSNVPGVQDNSTDSIIDLKEIELDSSLLNGKSANDSGSETIAIEKDDPVYKDRIDFMVLHSIYSSPKTNGIDLYEIAEFIDSFYDIDTRKSLPYIESYLKYSIEKGVLVKKGDKYKKAATALKLNSKECTSEQVKYDGVSWPMDESIRVRNKMGSNESDDVFLYADVKLEPEEIGDLSNTELVTDYEKIKMNGNNNSIPSIDEKQDAAERKGQKRTNVSLEENIPNSKRMRNELILGNTSKQCNIELDDTDDALAQYIKVEKHHIKLEEINNTEEPFASFLRRKILSFSFENVRERIRESSRVVQKLKPLQKCWTRILKSDLHRAFDEPIYTLAEISEYISRYPKIILNNPVALMWDLSWREIALTNNVPCLKLTGISTMSNENLDCKICGFEFKFGPSNCDFCYFETENILEKCNICGLLCNRTDVYNKHFLWEHRALIQGVDNIFVSISEENIEKLLSKLAHDDSFRCGICRYSTKNTEVFEAHMVCKHTSKMNVLPELPDEAVSDEVVIFRNEISNVCCLRCNECGFISNRKDFLVYHILDIHGLVENEICKEQTLDKEIESQKKDEPERRVKWSFGLCHICGNTYNHIVKHLRRHGRMNVATELNTNENKSIQIEHEALLDAIESLPLAERVLRKPKRPRRNKNTNKSYLCHICGHILKRRLYEHLRIHDPVMFRCNVCGRQFNRQSNLLTHMRVHTREKPFQCDICKMTFGYKCSIKGHIVNVHSETVR